MLSMMLNWCVRNIIDDNDDDYDDGVEDYDDNDDGDDDDEDGGEEDSDCDVIFIIIMGMMF